jgi:hypothetical protein
LLIVNDMRRTIPAVVLFTALCAMGYLVYELVVVKPGYEADLLRYMSCTAHREAALADWRYFQSHIDLYKTWRKHLEFAGFEKLEAIGKWKCPNYDDLTAPNYGLPGSVAIVNRATSLALFGAVNPKQG